MVTNSSPRDKGRAASLNCASSRRCRIRSREWNPIRCYDHMIANDDVVYVPFAFGYVNYASRTEEPHLRFADMPTPRRPARCSAAPASASARSRSTARRRSTTRCSCARRNISAATTSRQAASPARWRPGRTRRSTRRPAISFADTLRTIQASYLRPTHSGFIDLLPRVRAARRRRYRRRNVGGRTRRLGQPALPRNACPATQMTERRVMAERRQERSTKRGRPQRISRAGGGEGARHPGIHGRRRRRR